jgi:hypothetical protein
MTPPKNDFWSILVFFCGSVQVFHTKEDPAKDKRIVERATLITPPNDVVPVKDRFGMFSKPIIISSVARLTSAFGRRPSTPSSYSHLV